MNYVLVTILFTFGLPAGILAIMALGRSVGELRLSRHGDTPVAGVAVIDGAVFGLLGLLLACTFSGAASRSADAQPELRDAFAARRGGGAGGVGP